MVKKMSFLIAKHYRINFYEYDKIEEAFLIQINKIINQYPFKWHLFFYEIMQKKAITYFKDTTVIINLYSLNNKQVTILFEVVKELLKTKAITKVLYRQEFMIIHLYSHKIVEVLSSIGYWQAISYYYSIINSFTLVKAYLGGIISNETQKEKVDLIIINKEKVYLINGGQGLNFELDDNYQQYMLYLYKDSHFINYHMELISYSYSHLERKKEIAKRFFK